MERDAIHYLAINSVRVSVSAAPVDTRLPERGRSAERRIFTQTTETKDKAERNKKTRRGDGVGTGWCCRSMRARSVCGPICGAESWQGRSSLARTVTHLLCQDSGIMLRWVRSSDHTRQLHRTQLTFFIVTHTASGTRARGALLAATIYTAWSDTNWTSEPSKSSALFQARTQVTHGSPL